jgi:hypothetical protein
MWADPKISVALYSRYSALEGKAASIVSLTPAVLLCSYAHACMAPSALSQYTHFAFGKPVTGPVKQCQAVGRGYISEARQRVLYFSLKRKHEQLSSKRDPKLTFARVSCLRSSSDLRWKSQRIKIRFLAYGFSIDF